MPAIDIPNTFVDGQDAVASDVNQNFGEIEEWINTMLVHRDAFTAFTNIPSGPNTNPTSQNQLTRKEYVDPPHIVMTRTASQAATGVGTPTLLNSGWTTDRARLITATSGGCIVNRTGWYTLNIYAEQQPVSGGFFREAYLWVPNKGATVAARANLPGFYPYEARMNASTDVFLDNGDGIEVFAHNDASGSSSLYVRISVVGIVGSLS